MLQFGGKRSISSDEELESVPDFIVRETPRKMLPLTRQLEGSIRSCSVISSSPTKPDQEAIDLVSPVVKKKRRLVKLQDLESESSEECEKNADLIHFINNCPVLPELMGLEAEIMQQRPFSSIEKIPKLEKVLPLLQESMELEKFRVISQSCELSFSLLSLEKSPVLKENKTSLPSNQGLSLKTHQIFGVSWMFNLYSNGLGGILADEMGLGKTVQVIAFISHLITTGTDYGPFLVICPSSVLSNWHNEFERWAPHIKVSKYHGSLDERYDLRESISNSIIDVLLTTYSMATSTKDDKRFLKKLDVSVMFVDEGHFLKNSLSQKYISITSIPAKQRILITGTPLQNDLMELFSLLQFITPSRLGVDFDLLKRLFTSHSGENASNISKIKKIIEPFVLRRKKCDVLQEMPQKNEQIVYCPMNESQKKINAMLQLKNSNCSFYNVNIQLRKAACHPLLFRNEYSNETLLSICKKLVSELEYSSYCSSEDLYNDLCDSASDYEIHQLCKRYSKRLGSFCLPVSCLFNCEKISAVFRIYHQALQKDSTSKFLIFSQFITVLDILEDVLEEKSIVFCRLDGSTPVMTRQNLMDEFNTNHSIKVFLLSSKAAGFGINLCSANHVIMYDIDYNPQNDRQAEDRCHRIGQTKDVHVYKLITQGSVDEKALDIATGKIALDRQFH